MTIELTGNTYYFSRRINYAKKLLIEWISVIYLQKQYSQQDKEYTLSIKINYVQTTYELIKSPPYCLSKPMADLTSISFSTDDDIRVKLHPSITLSLVNDFSI